MVDVFRDALGELFRSGEVCLFDVIEEINSFLRALEQRLSRDFRRGVDGLGGPCKLLLDPVTPLFLEMSLYGSYLTSSRR